METPSYIAIARQQALQRELATVANNLANAETAGFNGEKMLFRQHLLRVNSHETLRRTEKMASVQDIGTARDTSQGELRFTGNDLDLAIQGDGYFTIETPLGPRYTRNGRFQVNGEGEIVTGTGLRVLDEGGQPLRLPQGTEIVKISPAGEVEAQLPAGANPFPVFQAVGRINVVTFENKQEMQQIGRGLFTPAGEAIPADNSRIAQGMVEGSNVQPILEMTRMIELTRNFSTGNSMLDNEHERLRRMIQTMTRTQSA